MLLVCLFVLSDTFFSLCVHVYTYSCMLTVMHIHMHISVDTRGHHLISFTLRYNTLSIWEDISHWPVGHQSGSTDYLVSPQNPPHWSLAHAITPSFVGRFWGPSSDLHICGTNILLIKPFPSLTFFLWSENEPDDIFFLLLPSKRIRRQKLLYSNYRVKGQDAGEVKSGDLWDLL